MEQIHKDALRRTRVALVKDLDVDAICDEVLAHDIFTQLMMEYIMAERTRIDKVRRLLDDLVRRGPNAYRAFLQVLNASGYKFLADKILHNEDLVRREKDPNTSFPVQATIEISSEIHPSSISSGFSISNLNNNARNSLIGPVKNNRQQNPVSLVSSESNLSSNLSSVSQSFSQPNSKSGVGGFTVHEMASTLSSPSESTDDDTLDLESGSLNPTSMDVDDEIDSRTEEFLLRDTGNEHGHPSISEGYSVQPTDTSHTAYSYDKLFTMMSFYEQSRSLDKCYKMESTPRGIVLIINNKDFGQNHKERTGTEYDCNKLKDLFGNLSFRVLERENLTAMEMKKELKAFTQNRHLQAADCLVLAVLSHGNSDKIICGIDSEGIDIYEHVFPLFSAKNCRMMRGKPKMFIFNACRGGKNGESFDTFRPQISRTTIPEKDQLQRDGPNIEPSDSQVLDMQDLLLCFSTFPGYSSYRDPNQGSWFIQEFVSVFQEQCSTEHVMDMLTEINRRVSQKKHSDQAAEMCVQMPFPSSSLTKKWYINPH